MSKVNWITVREVAELWEPQLGIPKSVIERELLIGLYKLEQKTPLDKPLEVSPDTVDLPSPDVVINRDFIERFNDKQLWKLPDFWHDDLPTGPSFPGRPSKMNAIVHELVERGGKKQLESTLAEQARVLSVWAHDRFPTDQTPMPKSLENGIRTIYWSLRRQ